MKIKIGRLSIEITVGELPSWEREAKELAKKVEEEAHITGGAVNVKIERIKALRKISDRRGWSFTLRDCKVWIETHFSEYGYGKPL